MENSQRIFAAFACSLKTNLDFQPQKFAIRLPFHIAHLWRDLCNSSWTVSKFTSSVLCYFVLKSGPASPRHFLLNLHNPQPCKAHRNLFCLFERNTPLGGFVCFSPYYQRRYTFNLQFSELVEGQGSRDFLSPPLHEVCEGERLFPSNRSDHDFYFNFSLFFKQNSTHSRNAQGVRIVPMSFDRDKRDPFGGRILRIGYCFFLNVKVMWARACMVIGFTPSIFGKNDAKPWVLEANPFHLILIILAYQRTFWDWNPSSQIEAGRYANGKKIYHPPEVAKKRMKIFWLTIWYQLFIICDILEGYRNLYQIPNLENRRYVMTFKAILDTCSCNLYLVPFRKNTTLHKLDQSVNPPFPFPLFLICSLPGTELPLHILIHYLLFAFPGRTSTTTESTLPGVVPGDDDDNDYYTSHTA